MIIKCVLKKLFSSGLAAALLFNHALIGADSTQVSLPEITPQPFSARTVAGLEIPPLLGILTDRYTSGEKLVIHLQDTHAHFEAQKNISKLIQFFFKNFPEGTPRLVLLEGASGVIDTSPLASIGDDEIRDRIATYFLKSGLITGAEYFSIMNPENSLLSGVDDRALYLQNLASFRQCQRQESELELELNSMTEVLMRIEQKVFSKPLLELNELRKKYERGETVLGQYCLALRRYWNETGSIEALFPNFSRIVQVTEMEAQLHFDLLNEEMMQLITSLQSILDKKQLENLIQKSLVYRLGKMDQNQYFRGVYEVASRAKVDFEPYKNLSLFFKAIFIREQLDPSRIFKELEGIDERIRNSLYRSRKEKEINRLDRFLASLDRLIHLSLSRDEFGYYEKERERYIIPEIPQLLRKFAVEFNCGLEMDDQLRADKIGSALDQLGNFYKTAIERDDAILSNVLKVMDEEKSPVSILITGGFHTSGMMEEFRKQNVSYMVVAPKVTTLPDRSLYLSTMMDEVNPFDRDLRSLAQRLVAPLKFAQDPFGDKTDWERIVGKAVFFQAFLERIQKKKGMNLAEAYAKFIQDRLVNLRRSDGSLRFSSEELKGKMERLKYVMEHLKIHWDELYSVQNSFYVPVQVGDKTRIVRVDKGKLISKPDIDAEDFGQLDDDITFYVLPERYTSAFKALSRLSSISGRDLESALANIASRDIPGLAKIFKNVKVKNLQIHQELGRQFVEFQRGLSKRFKWETGVLQSYRFQEDSLISIKRVEEVETISQGNRGKQSLLERRYDLVHATAIAARHAIRWLTDTGNKFISNRADKEGAKWLRAYFNSLEWFKGRVVIGEGERDKAPMLYIGEIVGRGEEEVDMAMDVIELTKGIIKRDVQGTVSIVAYSDKGGLLNAPDVYMRKILVGPQARGAGVDVTQPVSWNLDRISQKLGRPVSELRGALLLRPRHKKLIRDLLRAGINVEQPINASNDAEFEALWKRMNQEIKKTGFLQLGNLILMGDGDLMPAFGLATGKIDFIMGAGGAPEGVISAAVVESMKGEMSAQLSAYEVLQESAEDADLERDFEKYSKDEREKLSKFKLVQPGTEKAGEIPWNKVWASGELASGKDIVVIASAVKDSPWVDSLKGPKIDSEKGEATLSNIIASKTGRIKVARVTYDLGVREIRQELETVRSLDARTNLYLTWAKILGDHGLNEKAIELLKNSYDELQGTRYESMIQSAVSYYEGMDQLVLGALPLAEVLPYFERAIKADPFETLGLRDLLIRLYRHLAEEIQKANKDEANAFYRKAIDIAKVQGYEKDLEELQGKLAKLGVVTEQVSLVEDRVLTEVKVLLQAQTVDRGRLEEILTALRDRPALQETISKLIAEAVLDELFRQLRDRVGPLMFDRDARVKLVFTADVLSNFTLEAGAKDSLSFEVLRRLASDKPLELLGSLLYKGLLGDGGEAPYFFEYLNSRGIQLAGVLTSEPLMIERLASQRDYNYMSDLLLPVLRGKKESAPRDLRRILDRAA